MPTDIKSKPILFSGSMVKAILDGSKTRTRRVVKPQPNPQSWQKIAVGFYSPTIIRKGIEEPGPEVFGFASEDEDWKCPYGEPGGRLWLRETWQPCRNGDTGEMVAQYKSDWEFNGNPNGPIGGKWRSPCFMPRWASRITLEVTDVRVERVQDISEYDAECELPEPDYPTADSWAIGLSETTRCPIMAFEYLWDSINHSRGYGWDMNPFVWVVSFKLLELANKGA